MKKSHLFEQLPLLNDIRHCSLLHATGLVDILERIDFLRLLVFNNTDLGDEMSL